LLHPAIKSAGDLVRTGEILGHTHPW
jgi:hypothetical protein